IFSVGHGARTFEDFVATLASGGVSRVADVRAFPGSRRHPQFGRDVLAEALRGAGVDYRWLPALGGRRRRGPGPAPHPSWAGVAVGGGEHAQRAGADARAPHGAVVAAVGGERAAIGEQEE